MITATHKAIRTIAIFICSTCSADVLIPEMLNPSYLTIKVANKLLIKVLAEHFKVNKSNIHIVRGENSREKLVDINGL